MSQAKRERREENQSSFSPWTGVTFLSLKKKKKKKKRKWLGRRELVGVRDQAGAAAEMTIQSQDTAEDCTAASGELGRSAADAGAVQLAAPECRAPAAASPL